MRLFAGILFAALALPLTGCPRAPDVPPLLAVPEVVYLGTAEDVGKHLLARDVVWHEVEVYGGTACVVWATFDGDSLSLHAQSFRVADGALSPVYPVAGHDSLDHFAASLAVDGDGFFHLVWGAVREKRFYSRTERAGEIDRWTEPERFGDADATYQNLKAHGDRTYVLYRDGGHGQGWKLAWKARDARTWSEVKVVSGTDLRPKHPYLSRASQWLFEDPEHQFFAVYWTHDRGDHGGKRRFQRVTRYDLSAGKHHHLDGRVIGYGDGSVLPHQGPFDFYGQCGDIISDDFQPKYRDRGLAANRLGRLHLGVGRTGRNLVVLSNVGENPAHGFPPRGLRASVFDASGWSHRLLSFPFAEDMGADYVANVRGRGGETLWFVHRKPTAEIGQGAATDLVILRNTGDGATWTRESFTDDGRRWAGYLKAAWSPAADRYVLVWGELEGDLPLRKKTKVVSWRNSPPGVKGYDLYLACR